MESKRSLEREAMPPRRGGTVLNVLVEESDGCKRIVCRRMKRGG